MGTLETTYDLSRDFTVVKAVGKMTVEDSHDWADAYFAGTFTSKLLFDVTETDLTETMIEELVEAVTGTKQLGECVRCGGKIAVLIMESTPGYDFGRMPLSSDEICDTPYEWQTFTSMIEALEWLGVMQTDYDGYQDRQRQENHRENRNR